MLFNHSGRKIQDVVTTNFILEIVEVMVIAFLVANYVFPYIIMPLAILLSFAGREDTFQNAKLWVTIVVFACGVFRAWQKFVFFYGLGEEIENTRRIADREKEG